MLCPNALPNALPSLSAPTLSAHVWSQVRSCLTTPPGLLQNGPLCLRPELQVVHAWVWERAPHWDGVLSDVFIPCHVYPSPPTMEDPLANTLGFPPDSRVRNRRGRSCYAAFPWLLSSPPAWRHVRHGSQHSRRLVPIPGSSQDLWALRVMSQISSVSPKTNNITRELYFFFLFYLYWLKSGELSWGLLGISLKGNHRQLVTFFDVH